MIKLFTTLLFIGLAVGEICPDHYVCPGSTCCLLISGIYGCCPYKNGICCPDRIHCCSENEKCSVKARRCESRLETLPYNWLLKAGYGGSQMLKTVRDSMFEDHGASFMQINENVDGAMMRIQSNKMNTNKVKNIISDVIRCPDGRICKIGDSCCRKETGGFGCCPYVNATCCSDMIHCCPNGYQCDVEDNMCTLVELKEDSDSERDFGEEGKKSKALLLFKIGNAENCKKLVVQSQRDQHGSQHLCPNDPTFTMCPDNTTCCLWQKGISSECCPFPSGVCCDDGLNCCPNGFYCDIGNNRCLKSVLNLRTGRTDLVSVPVNPYRSASVTSIETIAKKERIENLKIVCPNGQDKCPDDTTCCMNNNNGYGCCTYSDAVCCSDRIHCCPNDYSCDLTKQACVHNSGNIMRIVLPFISLDKTTQIQMDLKTSDSVCPNGSENCHEGETCCLTDDQRYGCCTFANAVCCSDGEHCCPNGYTCDLENAECVMNSGNIMRIVLPFISLDKTTQIQTSDNQKACPDGTKCPDKSTCCKTKIGKYGCCPYDNGSCCPDGIHCCPSGSKCDDVHRRCIHNFLSNFMSEKESESQMYNTIVEKFEVPLVVDITYADESEDPMIMCPDKIDYCEDYQTCCELSGGRYGCCPTIKGVCCDDKETCCPHGTRCDSGGCASGLDSNAITNFIAIGIPYH